MALGLGLGISGQRRRFNPASLFAGGEPGVWYDPSDLTTLFQDRAGTTPVTAAGQSVGMILDKSGSGNHAVAINDPARGKYQTAGGLHRIAFDGVDDGYVTPTITPGTDKVQVFAGVRKLSDAVAYGVLAEMSPSSGANPGVIVLFVPNGASGYRFNSIGTIRATVDSGIIEAPVNSAMSALGDISGDSAILRINGTPATPTTTDQGTGDYLPYPLYIGMRAGTSLPFNGNLYALALRFGPTLTAAQIAQTEAWVARKTGVTL